MRALFTAVLALLIWMAWRMLSTWFGVAVWKWMVRAPLAALVGSYVASVAPPVVCMAVPISVRLGKAARLKLRLSFALAPPSRWTFRLALL